MLRRTRLSRVDLPACDFTPPVYTGASYDELVAKRAKFMNPVSFHFYKQPLQIASGYKQYVFDPAGRRYLDLFGGVTTVSVGHSHPRVNAAIADQSQRFNHTTHLYLTEPVLDFCELFASKLPKGHDWTVHMVNSGSEANDFAVLMSRVFTKSHPIVGLRYGYHGFTENSRGMNSMPGWRHDVPAPAGLLRTASPHPYRGIFGEDVDKYVAELDATLKFETGGKIAAFIAERIGGVGGAVELQQGFLGKAYDLVKAAGGLYISDEVQCGYGRLGTQYWGFEDEGIVPDIITSAKSVANGYPVGVVACKREISDAMRGVNYFNTFGGGGVCARVATETMKIIDDEGLQHNAHTVGSKLKAGLIRLQDKHEIIGQVRGRGLMLGFELVKARETKAPATDEAARFLELMLEEGVLVGKGGLAGGVIRVHPPLCITENDADAFLTAVDNSLSAL